MLRPRKILWLLKSQTQRRQIVATERAGPANNKLTASGHPGQAALGDAAQAPPNDEGPPPEDGLPPDDGDSSSSLSVDMDQFDGSLGESVVRKI